jgi:hypothetical protein
MNNAPGSNNAPAQALCIRGGNPGTAVVPSRIMDRNTVWQLLKDVLVTFHGPATSKRYFGVQFYLEDLFG